MNKFITRTLSYYDVRCIIVNEGGPDNEEKYAVQDVKVKVWESDPENEKNFFKDVADAVEMEFKGASLIKILAHSEIKHVVKVKMPLSMFTFFGSIVEAAEAEDEMEE